MEQLYKIEINFLRIFLRKMEYSDIEIDNMLNHLVFIKREIDSVGFYTYIYISDFDFSRMKERYWTGVLGKTKNGILVDLLVFQSNNDLMIEGSTFGDDLYPANETDYDVSYAENGITLYGTKII